MRRPLSNKQRFDIFKRDGFTCQYCGAHGQLVQLQVDHIEPVSKGGQCETDNFLTACRQCNSGKAASRLLPEQERLYTREEVLEEFSTFSECCVCGVLERNGDSLMSHKRDHNCIQFPTKTGLFLGICIGCMESEIKRADEWRFRMATSFWDQLSDHKEIRTMMLKNVWREVEGEVV